jgi:hypothetical protein
MERMPHGAGRRKRVAAPAARVCWPQARAQARRAAVGASAAPQQRAARHAGGAARRVAARRAHCARPAAHAAPAQRRAPCRQRLRRHRRRSTRACAARRACRSVRRAAGARRARCRHSGRQPRARGPRGRWAPRGQAGPPAGQVTSREASSLHAGVADDATCCCVGSRASAACHTRPQPPARARRCLARRRAHTPCATVHLPQHGAPAPADTAAGQRRMGLPRRPGRAGGWRPRRAAALWPSTRLTGARRAPLAGSSRQALRERAAASCSRLPSVARATRRAAPRATRVPARARAQRRAARARACAHGGGADTRESCCCPAPRATPLRDCSTRTSMSCGASTRTWASMAVRDPAAKRVPARRQDAPDPCRHVCAARLTRVTRVAPPAQARCTAPRARCVRCAPCAKSRARGPVTVLGV